MTPFLKEIASQIFEEQRENLQNVHILVPNRRAILYLKRYLSELSERPLWSPKMYSIEDFVFEAAGLQKCDAVDLIFELYAIHRNLAEQDARSFDHFAQWGEQLLRDFNDVDFYLADAGKLFSYLSEAKAIERWHVDGGELTENEKRYLEFYRSLAAYYAMLREKMLLEGKAWQGLAYRTLAEQFERHFEKFSGKPFYLIGFNALTRAEEEIFRNIQRHAPAKILWDADEYYLDNPQHEAGHFLREYKRKFGEDFVSRQHFKSAKNIIIKGISKNIGQALETGKILSEIAGDTEAPDRTAVVLNDEGLLFPTLDFIPEKYRKINVTMGYPLRLTQLFVFFVKWIELHLSAEKSGERYRFERNRFYDFLQHPVLQSYIQQHFFDKTHILHKNIETAYRKANAFVSSAEVETDIFKDLKELFGALDFAFKPWNNSYAEAIAALQKMTAFLNDFYALKEDAINLEILHQLERAVSRLEAIGKRYSDGISMQSLLFIFNRILQSVKIPFSGEPIGGLQVMGMLETRLLDYKNVVILSVNEGIIPSEGRNSTFIPFDIRRQFGLPTKTENNAVSSYHFYRLLQRAENIHIIYNADAGQGVSAGKEQSRFITQLLHELPKYNPEINIEAKIENIAPAISKPEKRFEIAKTDFVMRRLEEMAEKGFSATAINDYLNCPVEFYLKWIVKIPETMEFQSGVDARTFGTAMHETIKITHENLVDKSLYAKEIEPIFSVYKEELTRQFEKHWQGGDFHRGENFLTLISAQDYMEAFLQCEQEEIAKANRDGLPYSIVGQEFKVEDFLEIQASGGKKAIKIKGFVDRATRIGNTLQIIDFKTGKVEKREMNIRNVQSFSEEKNLPKAIQVLLYAWLMRKNGKIPPSCDVEAGLLSFRSMKEGFLPLTIEGKKQFDDDSYALIEEVTREVLEEIFNPELPFIPSEDEKTHQYSRFGMLYQ